MAQLLIVEGNDAIAIANLCIKRRLPPPKGYETKEKFRDQFVKSAGSYDKALIALEQSLDRTDLQNIGIIVDANDKGPQARLDAILAIIRKKISYPDLNQVTISEGGTVLEASGLPKIGIWIMPDNFQNGYLEHFLCTLVPENDEIFQLAAQTIENLTTLPFCKFSGVKAQKALLHTWLAWQESPGAPPGAAIERGFLRADLINADHFITWISRVFDYGRPNA